MVCIADRYDPPETLWSESSTPTQRTRLYVALLKLARNKLATVAMLEEEATEGEGEKKMGVILEGLVHLRELELVEKDGLKLYKLTEFGRKWAETDVLAGKANIKGNDKRP